MLDFGLVALGFAILILAGDVLVRGAVNLSLRLGVPVLIVSLTIVAIGTSAPELLIAVASVLEGAPGIALGNVVGSNTANVLLVLGVPAMLAGLATAEFDTRTSYVQMIAATLLFLVAAWFAPISWLWGLLLIAVFALFIGHAAFAALKHKRPEAGAPATGGDDEPAREAEADREIAARTAMMHPAMIALMLVLGLIGLPVGADILVNGATAVARNFGMSETVIGLTLVAVGTSLPELATTVTAAFRGQADVALGNVIGSNTANLLGIVGIAALFGPIPVPADIFRFEIVAMALASILVAPFVLGPVNLTRRWGLLFFLGYIAYLVAVLYGGHG